MSNIDKKPSIDKTAFCCPHCAAYTSQEWSVVYLSSLTEDDNKTPNIPSLEKVLDGHSWATACKVNNDAKSNVKVTLVIN